MQRVFGESVNIGECKEISINEKIKREGCTIMEDSRSWRRDHDDDDKKDEIGDWIGY